MNTASHFCIKVIRFVHGYNNRTSLRVSDFTDLGWLNVENRTKQLRLNHVHKIFNNKCPSYLHDHFRPISQVHSYNNRHSSYNFVVPRIEGVASGTFFYHGIKDWNVLSCDVMDLNLVAFKS